jgi:hypothetical protein
VATLIQLIQGILAGMSILATSVGLLYLASIGGVGINFVVNDTAVEISADHRAAVVDPPPTATSIPTPEIDPLADEAATMAVDDAAQAEAMLAPEIPASVALDYYNLIAPDLSAALVSLGRLSLLLANPRAEEEGWRRDTAELIKILDNSHERLLSVHPPAEASALHTFLIDATGRCLGVTASLDGDMNGIPPDLLTVVGKTLQRCTDETKSVVQQIY